MNADRHWNRQGVIYAGLVLVSLVVLVTMASQWMSANRQFNEAAADLAQCQTLVGDIAALRNRPRVASLEFESPQQITSRIVDAQAQSGLPPEALVSVAPAAPTRLANTEYQVRATELKLQHVPLSQLHHFAAALGKSEDGLVVRELSLTPDASRKSDASSSAETWNARLILTQLIYSPTSK